MESNWEPHRKLITSCALAQTSERTVWPKNGGGSASSAFNPRPHARFENLQMKDASCWSSPTCYNQKGVADVATSLAGDFDV